MGIIQLIRQWRARGRLRQLLASQPAWVPPVDQLQAAGWPATACAYFCQHGGHLAAATAVGSPLYLGMLAASGLTAHSSWS